jgi:mono/diheme cytochrome c family protein
MLHPVRECPPAHALRLRAWALALFVLLAAAPLGRASDDLATNPLPGGQTPLGHFDERDGESLYRTICQGCHMPDARGAQGAGAYPALAANPKLAAAAYPAAMVLGGRRGMPAFGGSLDDEQIANVVNYVRSHFDNHYADTYTAKDVAGLRASLSSPPLTAEPHAVPIARP